MAHYNLFNLSVSERSLVKNPAVKKAKILISKSESSVNGVSLHKSVFVEKTNDTERKIYGYALGPDEVDTQGHKITKDEVRKAVDRYNQNLAIGFTKGTGTGYEHALFDDSVAYPILNVYDETGEIAKAIGIPGDKIIKGAWLTGDQLTEKGYELYQKGEITGWSIGGIGEYEEIDTDTEVKKSITSQSLPKWLPSFFSKMKDFLKSEAPNLTDEAKEYITRNVISDIIFETKYQIYSSISGDYYDDDFLDIEWTKDKDNKDKPKEIVKNTVTKPKSKKRRHFK